MYRETLHGSLIIACTLGYGYALFILACRYATGIW
jgi:hypothetical protein